MWPTRHCHRKIHLIIGSNKYLSLITYHLSLITYFRYLLIAVLVVEINISTSRLNGSPHLHLRPINLIVSEEFMIPNLGVGFALRCFQRLSLPHLATQRCPWRDNWYTRGASSPILSYKGQLPSSIICSLREHTRINAD